MERRVPQRYRRRKSCEQAGLRDRVIAALRTVYDPEMPVNIYELGLVYEVRADEAGQVGIA